MREAPERPAGTASGPLSLPVADMPHPVVGELVRRARKTPTRRECGAARAAIAALVSLLPREGPLPLFRVAELAGVSVMDLEWLASIPDESPDESVGVLEAARALVTEHRREVRALRARIIDRLPRDGTPGSPDDLQALEMLDGEILEVVDHRGGASFDEHVKADAEHRRILAERLDWFETAIRSMEERLDGKGVRP